MKFQPLFLLFTFAIILITSCKKDDPIIPNEEELITTLLYTLIPVNGGETVTLSFKDLDGDGGQVPDIIGGVLNSGINYAGELQLLNEANMPIESITSEILEEADDHQFFFQSDVQGLSITYDDQDSNGSPIGLTTKLISGETADGSLTITLRHLPNKSAEGVASGDINNAGGETDIEVTFPIVVQ